MQCPMPGEAFLCLLPCSELSETFGQCAPELAWSYRQLSLHPCTDPPTPAALPFYTWLAGGARVRLWVQRPPHQLTGLLCFTSLCGDQRAQGPPRGAWGLQHRDVRPAPTVITTPPLSGGALRPVLALICTFFLPTILSYSGPPAGAAPAASSTQLGWGRCRFTDSLGGLCRHPSSPQ